MRKANAIVTTIKSTLHKYFVAKQRKHLIIQSIIKKHTTNEMYSKANTQQ